MNYWVSEVDFNQWTVTATLKSDERNTAGLKKRDNTIIKQPLKGILYYNKEEPFFFAAK